MNLPQDAYTLFYFNRVPVKARPGFWAAVLMLWSAMAWLAGKRRSERSLIQRIAVGSLSAFIGLSADLGHALAHTVSARRAGAPMDAVLLGADMPRTLYANNNVSPQTHRMRALGGPIFSRFGFLVSFFWRHFTAPGTLSRELADISTFAHGGLFLGSLTPLPVVDGGVILKWTLVEKGYSQAQADQIVRRTALSAGAVAVAGVILSLLRLWDR